MEGGIEDPEKNRDKGVSVVAVKLVREAINAR